MASAVDSRLAYARLSAVATASRLPTATRGSNNSYTTSWDTTSLNPTVDKELDALPPDMRARFVRIAELIKAVGLERVGAPHIGHLSGPLWEMRMKGKDGISRALYVTVREKRVVVVRVFAKKTRKTPRQEIELALQRAQGGLGMTSVRDLHKKWSRDPA